MFESVRVPTFSPFAPGRPTNPAAPGRPWKPCDPYNYMAHYHHCDVKVHHDLL